MTRPYKVYIAGSMAAKDELRQRRAEIESDRLRVVSRWLDEDCPPDNVCDPGFALRASQAADKDMADIDAADAVVVDARTMTTTGGFWFEFGYALGRGKRILLIGGYGNVFAYAGGVLRARTWENAGELLRALTALQTEDRPKAPTMRPLAKEELEELDQ